jgi:hypothetical protein
MATVVFPALDWCTFVTGIGAPGLVLLGCHRLVWARHAALAVLGTVFDDGPDRCFAVQIRAELFLEALERM